MLSEAVSCFFFKDKNGGSSFQKGDFFKPFLSCAGFPPNGIQTGLPGSVSLNELDAQVSPSVSGPHLHGHHGLLGADGREEVLLAQELQRKLDQEAADLLQLLVSLSRVLLVQARLGQVALQLQDVPDVAGRQTPENLQGRGRMSRSSVSRTSENRSEISRSGEVKHHSHLLVDGGVASAGGHPDLLVELVADGIRHVDGGVGVSAQNGPERENREEEHEET